MTLCSQESFLALQKTSTEKVAYPIAYAARLASIDASTARRWVAEKRYIYKGRSRSRLTRPPTTRDMSST